MQSTVMDINALPSFLFRMMPSQKVRVSEMDGIIQLAPVEEVEDCTDGLRGMFKNNPEMSVEKFLERKRADKELER
jgi:hypothetical protein